jgi:hypothetical protein
MVFFGNHSTQTFIRGLSWNDRKHVVIRFAKGLCHNVRCKPKRWKSLIALNLFVLFFIVQTFARSMVLKIEGLMKGEKMARRCELI